MKTNSRLKINSDEFSKSIDLFQKKIKIVSDKLDNISNLMKEIDGKNETWYSPTSKAVSEEFLDIETNFEKINTKLLAYDTFLQDTLEEYKNEEIKYEKAIKDNIEDLNIN